MKEFKEIIKDRNAMLLWFSRSISRFGDAFESLALMYLVYDLTGSALKMGTVMLFSFIPNIVLSPFAGVIADKFNKIKIMLLTELVRTIFILLIPIFIYLKTINIYYIYAIAFIVSIAESFYEPAYASTVVYAIKKELLPISNSLVTTTNAILKALGFTLAGVLIVFIGKEVLFIIDSSTFLFSAITVLLLKVNFDESSKMNKTHIFKDLNKGLKYLKSQKLLIVLLSVILIVSFVLTPLEIFLPIIAKEVLKQPATLAGLLMTFSLIGNVLGGSSFAFLYKTKLKLYFVYMFDLLLISITILLMFFFKNKYLYLLSYTIITYLNALIANWSTTKFQQIIDKKFIGRVGSIANIVFLAGTPAASYIAGFLIDKISILNLFKYMAILLSISAIIYFFIIKRLIEKKEKIDIENEIEKTDLNYSEVE